MSRLLYVSLLKNTDYFFILLGYKVGLVSISLLSDFDHDSFSVGDVLTTTPQRTAVPSK